MAKQEETKSRLLHLMEIFREMTDETHVMSTSDLNTELMKRMNMKPASRTTLYGDIEVLREFGMDILLKKGRDSGYYLASQEFELAELKVLVDVVQASRFITKAKSEKLIQKLEKLTSTYEAKKLHRQVFVTNGSKAVNEGIFYNVDEIHHAIYENRKIGFQYCVWNEEKELVPKKEGSLYIISPWALIWHDENYYMIGFDGAAGQVKHYRVDKMRKIAMTTEAREGQEYFTAFDTAQYAKKMFGMFSGEETRLVLRCKKEDIGIIIDRFGTDITIKRLGDKSLVDKENADNYLEVWIQVAISNQFYGWIAGLGGNVEIIRPESIVENYKAYLKRLL